MCHGKSTPLNSSQTEPVKSWARPSLCSALPLPANFHDDHLLKTSATSPAQVPQPLCGRGVRTDFLKVGLLPSRSPRGSPVDCALTIGAQRNLMEPMCCPIFLTVTRWPREHLFSIIPRHVWDERICSPGGAGAVCLLVFLLSLLVSFIPLTTVQPPLNHLFTSPYPRDLLHCLFLSVHFFLTHFCIAPPAVPRYLLTLFSLLLSLQYYCNNAATAAETHLH